MNPNNPDMRNLGQKHGQKQSSAVTSTLYRNPPMHASSLVGSKTELSTVVEHEE